MKTHDAEQNIVIKDKASTHYSFSKGSTQQNYPNSLMGAVALLKQSFLDADWYFQNKGKINEVNLSLEAIHNNKSLPKIIEVRDKIRVLLAQKVGREMNYDFIIMTTSPILPPNMNRLLTDDNYYVSQNLLALRTTRLCNFLGGCALTLPTNVPSCGVTLMGSPNSEESLLRYGLEIERNLNN